MNYPRGEPMKNEKAVTPVGVDLISALPDEILVHIGTRVAKLCGIRNFARLSQASKRFRTLLIDSEETVTDVLRTRTAQIEHSTISSSRIVLRTLEQLALYESCCGCYSDCLDKEYNLLEKNLITADFGEREFYDHVTAVQRILERNPSASVILENHRASEHIAKKVVKAILKIPTWHRSYFSNACYFSNTPPNSRVSMRYWERGVTNHPYTEKVKNGKPWMEIFLRIENHPDSYEPSTMYLELPPRPDFYNNFGFTQKLEREVLISYADG